ncbi:MAG TPA: PIG-L deacetylase family protein [Chloroflexota bacterium]|nr:PIG-L deacetylase family protein [Chloroflexota bacterium]
MPYYSGAERAIAGQPERVLAVMAHPDDADFTVAGTIALWARQGAACVYLLCTDGNKGSADPTMTPERLAPIRRAEQRAALARLGGRDVWCLGYEDGVLEPSLALRRAIAEAICRFRPDVVVCQDPTTYFFGAEYVNHPDHRAAGEAALAAVFPTARNRLIFPELFRDGLEPWAVPTVYLVAAQQADTWVDVTATLDQKLAALAEHQSQFALEQVEPFVRGWAAENGKALGVPYAEAFRVLRPR